MGKKSTLVPWAFSGFGLMGLIVSIPIVLVVFLIIVFAFYEGRIMYWDYQIKKICEQDGDGKIMQTVVLNEQEYARLLNKFGKLEIPLSTSKEGMPLFQIQDSTYIRRSDPEVRQDKTTIIRGADGVILATQAIYSRVGGDLVTFHPSYYSCPEKPLDIYSKVIVQSREKQ
ncbi:MAG: hypothetical protein KF834_10330 [Burkholderiales bacterium]|nr:hypothetical protein [Burkholderiales bacterium]